MPAHAATAQGKTVRTAADRGGLAAGSRGATRSAGTGIAILGHGVTDPAGKEIGRIVDVLVGDQGEPQAAVIDFGGFMGVGNRKIAVQWSALHFAPTDAKQPITLDLTQDQLKAAPEYKDVAKPAPVVLAPETPR